jgi:uncharacterized RDD family membrane protein YckC
MAAPADHRRARVHVRTDAQAAARRVHGAPEEEAVDQGYAGFATRTLAFAADAAIIDGVAIAVGVVVALVLSVLPESEHHRTLAVAIGGGAFFVWAIGYFTAFWATTGQTPGNRMMRIRVTRVDGTPLRPRHAAVRVVGIVLAALPLFAGFVPILVTDRRRGLQDYLAGSVVRELDP